MPIKILVALFFLINCLACNQNRKKEVPKVLENKKTTIEKAAKRGEEDLVDGLYNEAANTNEDLKNFEAGIQQLQHSKSDSLSAFATFDDQNKKYYNSASKYADGISDSILRYNVKSLISLSLSKYDSSTNTHDSLLKTIYTKEATLKDLRNVLKIVYTLPLINKYQADNLPAAQPIKSFSLKQNDVIKLADTLIKK